MSFFIGATYSLTFYPLQHTPLMKAVFFVFYYCKAYENKVK